MNAAKTAIIILAAGESSRLGHAKQLIDVDGEPLVRHIACLLLTLNTGPVGVVVGADRDRVIAALGDASVEAIDNEAWEGGIGSSIVAGIRWAHRDDSNTRAMIALCDQPTIGLNHYRALLASDRADTSIVATRYADTFGVPAVFAREHFHRLLALPADRGAKSLLNDSTMSIRGIPCKAAQTDLDTPDDLLRWNQQRIDDSART